MYSLAHTRWAEAYEFGLVNRVGDGIEAEKLLVPLGRVVSASGGRPDNQPQTRLVFISDF